ncbi:HAMP domain-containing protein [bacterium]|nr:HAMP domain-containing protein [bacterium]
MKFSSVRFRLTLWNIGVLALVLFGFLAVMHFSVRSYLLSETDHRLSGMAKRHLDIINKKAPSNLPPPPKDDSASEKKHFRPMVHQFDLKGKQVFVAGEKQEIKEPPWDEKAFKKAMAGERVFTTIAADDTILRVISLPIRKKGTITGVIQVAVSFAEVQVMLESLTMTLTVLVPIALLVAGIGGLFLTSRALKPIRQMVDTAEAISDSDLSQRLPVIGADEFAHLAATINGMLARLDKAFKQLKDAFDRERRFTSDASHELRTPLTAIKANTSLALLADRTPEQYRETISKIDQSADAMSSLVQDLLLLARSDAGQLAREFQPVDPHDLFDNVLAVVRRTENDAKVTVDVADSTGLILGDMEHLNRLVINLLENALRHTPSDGEVTLSAQRRDGMVELAVADTGCGIAPEHLSHLGERFYRVDAARTKKSGGAGLGLAICRSIVEAHNGSMAIGSSPGQGTRVTVTLSPAKK